MGAWERWLTKAEIAAFPGDAPVDVAIYSDGKEYYGASDPTDEDPTGLLTAQFVTDEDGFYIPVG